MRQRSAKAAAAVDSSSSLAIAEMLGCSRKSQAYGGCDGDSGEREDCKEMRAASLEMCKRWGVDRGRVDSHQTCHTVRKDLGRFSCIRLIPRNY